MLGSENRSFLSDGLQPAMQLCSVFYSLKQQSRQAQKRQLGAYNQHRYRVSPNWLYLSGKLLNLAEVPYTCRTGFTHSCLVSPRYGQMLLHDAIF